MLRKLSAYNSQSSAHGVAEIDAVDVLFRSVNFVWVAILCLVYRYLNWALDLPEAARNHKTRFTKAPEPHATFPCVQIQFAFLSQLSTLSYVFYSFSTLVITQAR